MKNRTTINNIVETVFNMSTAEAEITEGMLTTLQQTAG